MQNLITYFTEELSPLRNIGNKDKKIDKDVESQLSLGFVDAMLKKNFKIREGGVIMAYNGRCYEMLKDKMFQNIVFQTLRQLEVGIVYITNSIKVITNNCLIGNVCNEFSLDKTYICFENVVLNIKTLEVLDHSPDILTDFIMPYDYDPKAKCEKFLDFLSFVLPNPKMQRVLQEFSGAFLVDRKDLTIQIMCYLIGSGLNGKGVFMETIFHTLGGERNCGNFSMSSLTTELHSEYYVAKIDGKIANFDMDASKSDTSGGTYKKLVAGEPVDARFIRNEPFQARHIPLFMAGVNEPPATTDHTSGHTRRNLWIPFSVTIPAKNVDQRLLQKLLEEKSRIFNWLIQGKKFIEEQNGKFTEEEEITELARRIKIESNGILMFLDERKYVPQSDLVGSWLLLSDIYLDYISYCEENRNRNIFTKQNFGRFLTQQEYQKKNMTRGVAYCVYKAPEKEGDCIPMIDEDNDVPF